MLSQTPPDDIWDQAVESASRIDGENDPDSSAAFASLPSELAREKSYSIFRRQLEEHLYRTATLELMRCELVDCTANAGESHDDFQKRIEPLAKAKADAERARIEQQFDKKRADLESRIKAAEARVSSQKWQFFARIGTMLWVIADTVMSLLGKGLPGRRRSLDPAFRSVATERGQQATAQATLDKLLDEKAALEKDREKTLADLDSKYQTTQLPINTLTLKPRKTDIVVDRVLLAWLPFRIDAQGTATPVYKDPTSESDH
jgi:hypothetical protein